MSDDHCVIINWNEKGPGIVEQLRSPELPKRQIVIITRGPADRKDIVPEGNGIRYIFAESITEDVLKRANVQEAHSVIILADKDGAHGVGP